MSRVIAMSDDEVKLKEAKENWQLYYTLSQEILKFIEKNDVDQFLELVNQRNSLIERMKALPETEVYRQTDECRALVEKIKPVDMQAIYKAKAWLNKSRRQNATAHAYDLQTYSPVGNIVNRNY